MKHAQLCAIAHNVADSMASGMCFPMGVYSVDAWAEAARSPDGILRIM